MQGTAVEPIEKWAVQLRKGCLELAILACLWSERGYGLEIVRRLADGGRLVVPEGTIYPLLSRLNADGWVEAEWEHATAGHPRKYYGLTARGRERVREMARSWWSFTASMDDLLAPLATEVR